MSQKQIRTDRSLSARGAVQSRHLEQSIGIHLKRSNQLRLPSRHRRDTRQLKLAQKPIIPALRAFSLIHRERHRRLIILHSRERPALIRRNGGVSGDDDAEDVSLHGYTEGKRGDVEEEEVSGLVGGLASEDSGLDGCAVGDGFVGVDGLVELTSAKEFADEGLDLGDTSGTADEDDIVDLI